MIDFLRLYPEVTDAIGVIGSLLYIMSFYLVQTGRTCGNGFFYAGAKVLAAACVLISLVNAFNLASFLIQVSFIAIGVWGMARKYDLQKQRPHGAPRGPVHTGTRSLS